MTSAIAFDGQYRWSAEETHARAMARGARCHECPLFGCRRGPVLGQIVQGAALAVIGEAPGRHEVDSGFPFVGASGSELDAGLFLGGLRRDQVTITNVLGCQPPETFGTYLQRLDRDYRRRCADAKARSEPIPPEPPSPIDCCRPRLERDLGESGSKTLLAVGGQALKALAEREGFRYGKGKDNEGDKRWVATVKNQHGAPKPLSDGRVLCSSLHPAFAMRGAREYKFVIQQDIGRAARIALRGGLIDWQEPPYILFPTIDVVEQTLWRFLEHRATSPVTIDIETDSADSSTCRVRCVGMGADLPALDGSGRIEEVVIVVPFRWMDGRRYWPGENARLRAIESVRAALDGCNLIAHNGLFDTAVCLRVGLMTDRRKTWLDTMIAHHNTQANDLPHSLDHVATRYNESPKWKQEVDHKASKNVERDQDLHLYNGRDVVNTKRSAPHLWNEIVACGNGYQQDVDTRLMPTARDAGMLGLVINEWKRGELAEKFTKLCRKFEKKVQQIVRFELNPRSPKQVGDWLYVTKGLAPPLNTESQEWEEGDDWSTSTPALLRLRDDGVDDETRNFIDAMISSRAVEKLSGTYVGGLKESGKMSGPDVRYLDELTDWAGFAPAAMYGDDVVLLRRPGLGLINIDWKLHIVPTGRWSSSPNAQNWPSRAWGFPERDPWTGDWLRDELGRVLMFPTNTREMVVAPPGHVLVGADFQQIELRLYAWFAQDRLLLKAFKEDDPYTGKHGFDPHTLNVATLFCESKNPSEKELLELYGHFIKWKKGTQAEKEKLKHLRTIAKRFVYLCIAEGQEVLTDVGLIPIEEIELHHKIWDGVEWVSHGGVIYKGQQEVVTYDELTATARHKVWLDDGREVALGDAAARGEVLARTGKDRNALRFLGDDERGLEGGQLPFRDGALHEVRCDETGLPRQLIQWQVEQLSELSEAIGSPRVATLPGFVRAAALHQPAASELEVLRRSGDRVPLRIGGRSRAMDYGEFGPRAGEGDRSSGQRWPLRGGEPALCNTTGAESESAQQPARKVARVYDILNAGPRHRFTVSGRLVSNCTYGGEEGKLFYVMAAERDKATQELVFPDVTPADVEVWYERWHRLHPETKQWQDSIGRQVREQGYVTSLMGRKRFFPGGPNKKNAPPNHLAQSSAADIMNRAILAVVEEIPFGCWSPWTGLVLQVHDYLGLYVPEAKAEVAQAIVKKCMYFAHDGIEYPPDDVLATYDWASNG